MSDLCWTNNLSLPDLRYLSVFDELGMRLNKLSYQQKLNFNQQQLRPAVPRSFINNKADSWFCTSGLSLRKMMINIILQSLCFFICVILTVSHLDNMSQKDQQLLQDSCSSQCVCGLGWELGSWSESVSGPSGPRCVYSQTHCSGSS